VGVSISGKQLWSRTEAIVLQLRGVNSEL